MFGPLELSGTGMMLCQGRFRLGVLTQRVAGANRLLRAVVTAPSPTELSERLENPPGDRVSSLGLLCAGPGAGLSDPCGPLPVEDIL